MISRSFDHKFIEGVITHPSVIKGARAWEGIELKEVVDNLDNYLLVNEFGGFLVIQRMPGVYECHTQFLPSGRGDLVRESVTEAIDYMFVNTDCQKIITRAYKDNPASIKLSNEFFNEEGQAELFYYYSLNHKDWVGFDVNCKEGQSFHVLAAEETNHEDDTTHDCYVGAAIRMAKAGNVLKAQYIYNDWAIMSGYAPIVILKNNPLLIEVGGMMLEIGQEVRLCL